MRHLEWISSLILYAGVGWFLPWWSPGLVGLAIGFTYNRPSCWRLTMRQSAYAMITALIPALMHDIGASGRTSLAISGLVGVQFHPLGFLLSLCVPGILAGLGSSCGADLREALKRIRRRQDERASEEESRAG